MEGGELTQSPENRVNRWEYSRFYEYLHRVAINGKGELEPIRHYPEAIELDSVWHETLDKMRRETKDGYERWTPIGFQRDLQGILIPTDFKVGTKNQTPELVVDDEVRNYHKLGLNQIIGNIHSHPENSYHHSSAIFLTTGRLKSEFRGFSTKDLKNQIELSSSDFPFLIFGLVDGDSNFFSFITKDTETLPSGSPLRDDQEFTYYWYKKFAPSFLEKLPPVRSTLWEINKRIAEKYKLAVFRGKPGKELERGFP